MHRLKAVAPSGFDGFRSCLFIRAPALVIALAAAVLDFGSAGPSAAAPVAPSVACATLGRAVVADAKVLSSDVIGPGRFPAAPDMHLGPDLVRRIATLPAFCRVQARAVPTPSSSIGIELWLPLDHWNGRFLGVGNGGAAGSIAYGMGMVEGLQRGFAVANTDMGVAPDIETAADLPERWTDFGHRATHEMTRVGQALTRDFYQTAAFRSYFEGCSTGGQQALSEAQRYPADYDGILVGDPGGNRTHSTAFFLWNYQAMNVAPESRLTEAQWDSVTRAVIETCGGKDGGALGDPFLTDPRRCRFDPTTLPRCEPGSDAGRCFNPAQIQALARLYAGAVNPSNGERIYAGLTPGSESLPLGPLRMSTPDILSRLFVLRWGMGAAFAAKTFDFDHDMDRLDARLSSTLNANDSDLHDFMRHGGKLILYNGLADPGVPFPDTVAYYERVLATVGDAEGFNSARLFLVPGMGHCLGGPGATDFGQPLSPGVPADRDADVLMSLVAWTEGAKAPDRLLARSPGDNGSPTRERPLCAYPALPTYTGGDPVKSASFACRAAPRGAGQTPSPHYIN